MPEAAEPPPPPPPPFSPPPPDLRALDPLVSPYGVVSGVSDPRRSSLLGRSYRSTAHVGDPAGSRGKGSDRQVVAGGRALDSTGLARFVALAEAAERYAGCDVLGEEHFWATARDLAGDRVTGDCLEFERFPTCSAAEYAHPSRRIVPFDPDAPIRWTRGTDLITRRPVWVPAVMACYGITDQTPEELFNYPISTGYAVHTDPVEAVVRGIAEVVERDIVAVLWLQRLPLPSLPPATLGDEVFRLVANLERRFVRPYFFDATTDLGVPTVYCVLVAEHDRLARTTVAAGTGRGLAEAALKSAHEAVAIIESLHEGGDHPAPEEPADLRALTDAARYMARPDRAEAFSFLLDDADERVATGPGAELPADPVAALDLLTTRLADAGARPVVMDRTTRELADCGFTAVSVVIPDLQPMSVDPLIQFRGHRRLYESPARMGYGVRTEAELNPWPQPFA
ncbi:YcaO-like family protein [Streptomyces sp. NBC_01508]|uniref:YcaO-like family protein n=1 Tax=Streptomyces sp. NBC_01508 TaxID=2903888 RepID=UPI00386EAC85